MSPNSSKRRFVTGRHQQYCITYQFIYMYRPSGLKYFLYSLTVKGQPYRLLHPACIVLGGLLLMISEFKLSLSMTCITLPRSRSGYNNVVHKWCQHTPSIQQFVPDVQRRLLMFTCYQFYLNKADFNTDRKKVITCSKGHCLLKRSLIFQKRTKLQVPRNYSTIYYCYY